MALSEDFNRDMKHFEIKNDRVLSTATIYKGAIVTVVSLTGYAKPGADAAGEIFRGIALRQAVGVAGSNEVRVELERTKVWKFCTGSPADQSWVGQVVYCVDDETVDLAGATTNDVRVGICDEVIDASNIWVWTIAGS